MTYPVSGASSGAARDWFNIMDKRMALMSKMTGRETEQLLAINDQDKEYSLEEEQVKTRYDYNIQWQDSLEALRKKELQHKQNLFNAGAIFA